MTFTSDDLSAALSRLELDEAALLSWGAVDARFTRSEALELIRNDLPAGVSAEDVLKELLARMLVVELPSGGMRTRMAETVRLLATLRQTFRNQRWWEGPPLVLDHRFLHRARRRPTRDRPSTDLLNLLADQLSVAGRQTAQALAPPKVSGFQERSAVELLRVLGTTTDAGLMITAGTGSGKTLAFYLPALAWIADSISEDPAHGVRALAIYPRNELLKDQLSAVLRYTRTLQHTGQGVRPIVVGTWFGPTPTSRRHVTQGWTRGWDEARRGGRVIGWQCPFLSCLDCGGTLVWLRSDLDSAVERLQCTDPGCGASIDDRLLNLTRDAAVRRPADILFTTSESLNRQLAAPDQHQAFGIRGRRARLVLLDEVHTYEGASGAQNALLMRRVRHAVGRPLVWVGLSATLLNADQFLARFTGIDDGAVAVVAPRIDELEESGAEYLIALRHDPAWRTGPLSTTIQAAMLLPRCLDAVGTPYNPAPSSGGLFGNRAFVFTDKLDVTNRLYWDLLDAEGWRSPQRPARQAILTLAHLRAESQLRRPPAGREPSLVRDQPGQWWWLPEQLGRDLSGDEQLLIGRTSSQDVGVSENADLIVATATLEVGYNDDRVGAILQHKAPHDAARFLQRKGRAGRDPRMRPWTVVVLSDWGRDRRAWQLYDDLFDPQLRPRHLPLNNRYVLRMQAVYALMDLLGRRLERTGDDRSVWADLAGPADVVETSDNRRRQRIERQKAAADLLQEVLNGGPARAHLRAHLLSALGLRFEHEGGAVVDALLWEPPRSLMLSVIPTALRRLRYEWAGEIPAADDPQVRTRTPLREFIAGNLFDDLLIPEVRVVLPNRTSSAQPADEYLPAIRTLHELMPGNVTRHFGIHSASRRHWIPAQASMNQAVDVTRTYGATYVDTFQNPRDPSELIRLYRPMSVSLQDTPPNVWDATTSSPDWAVHLQPLGGGRPARLGKTRWTRLITEIAIHTHAVGGGVRIRRYATSGSGNLFQQANPLPFSFQFSDNDGTSGDTRVGLGVELDVDGLRLTLSVPDPDEPPTRFERTERLASFVTDGPSMPADIPWFHRQQLATAALLVLAEISGEDPAARMASLSNTDLRDRLVDALTRVNLLAANSNTPNAPGMNSGRALPAAGGTLVDWCGDAAVLDTVRQAATCVSADRDDAWRDWWRRRVAASVGTAFLDAIASACPDVDVSDLAIDIDPQGPAAAPEVAQVWLTELSPGGNGHIEQIQSRLARDPSGFTRLLDAAVGERELERLDRELRAFIAIARDDPLAADACEDVRQAWSGGHTRVSTALDRLRRTMSNTDLTVTRLGWTVITTRLLGPGAHPDLPGYLRDWLDEWDSIERRLSMEIDARVFGAVIAAQDDIPRILRLPSDASTQRRALAAANLFWPRGGAAARGSGDTTNPFGLLPQADLAALRGMLGSPAPHVPITNWDDETRSRVHQILIDEARLTLVIPAALRMLARQVLLALQTDPVDLGALLGYPQVVGLRQGRDQVEVMLALTEADA